MSRYGCQIASLSTKAYRFAVEEEEFGRRTEQAVCFALQDPHQQYGRGRRLISTHSITPQGPGLHCVHSPLEFEDQVARYITAHRPSNDHHAHRRVTIGLFALRLLTIINYNTTTKHAKLIQRTLCRYPRPLCLHLTCAFLPTLPRAFRSTAQQCTRTPRPATVNCLQ